MPSLTTPHRLFFRELSKLSSHHFSSSSSHCNLLRSNFCSGHALGAVLTNVLKDLLIQSKGTLTPLSFLTSPTFGVVDLLSLSRKLLGGSCDSMLPPSFPPPSLLLLLTLLCRLFFLGLALKVHIFSSSFLTLHTLPG